MFFKKTNETLRNIETGLIRLAGHVDGFNARLDVSEEETEKDLDELNRLTEKLSEALERMDSRLAKVETEIKWLERTQCETYGGALERVRAMLAHEEAIKSASTSVVHLR